MKEIAALCATCIAAGVFVLWLNMCKNYLLVLKHRKPGMTESMWLIYEPQKLSDEGAQALSRYWRFGFAAIALASVALFGGVAIFNWLSSRPH